MVNKTALGVLGVIILSSMGVGILIGMQMGGPASGQTADGNETGGDATPLPNETTSSPTPFPEAPPTAVGPGGPSPTVTLAERTTVSYRRFDENRIAALVKDRINDRRERAGLSPLQADGNTVDRLDAMATTHSIAMADAGKVRNFLDGNSSADRYREFGLYSSCAFSNEAETFIVDADGNQLEVIGEASAGRAYGTQANPQFNENESQVADQIVREWWADRAKRDRLSWDNAERIGVGVEVTQDGSVYTTANLC